MMGTEQEVELCTVLLEEDERIEYTDKRDMTLKEYIAYLIKKDCEGCVYNGKKMD